MSQLRQCTSCLLPETYETIEFDDKGVCNVCRGKEYRDTEIDWSGAQEAARRVDRGAPRQGRLRLHRAVLGRQGLRPTRCWYLMKEYKIKPLVVRFDHGFMREGLLDNNAAHLQEARRRRAELRAELAGGEAADARERCAARATSAGTATPASSRIRCTSRCATRCRWCSGASRRRSTRSTTTTRRTRSRRSTRRASTASSISASPPRTCTA